MPANALPVRCHVIEGDKAKLLEEYMVQRLPDCYISLDHLKERVIKTGMSASEILATKLPDPGCVMSGDFGELVTLYFLSAQCAEKTIPIKKWRYKQDRLKATPHSDVIMLYCSSPGKPSPQDYVICAETKQRATTSDSKPIQKAIEGYEKDKVGRLARTLTWLREKAIAQEKVGDIELVNRFTIDVSVDYLKYFKAVAIVDRTLLDEEITQKIELPQQNASLEIIVLGIEGLKNLYEAVFRRALKEVAI